MSYEISKGKPIDFQAPEGINVQITHIGLNLGEPVVSETFLARFLLEKVVPGSLNVDGSPVIRTKTVNVRLKNKKVVSAEEFPVLTPGTAIKKVDVYCSRGHDYFTGCNPYDSVMLFYTEEKENEISVW